MSDQMIQKWVETLEQATDHRYSIDAENEVVMHAGPALPLAIEYPQQYTAPVAACVTATGYQFRYEFVFMYCFRIRVQGTCMSC